MLELYLRYKGKPDVFREEQPNLYEIFTREFVEDHETLEDQTFNEVYDKWLKNYCDCLEQEVDDYRQAFRSEKK